MRIEAYTQVQQMYQTKKTNASKSVSKAGFSDEVQISSMGKEIQVAKQAVANSSDIREELVAPLKSSVQSGNYDVNVESFADKLFEKYNNQLI